MGKTAAIIGSGAIGGGWAARFLLMGWDVRVFDPDPEAKHKVGNALANARRSLPGLYEVAMPKEGELTFHDAMSDAVAGADWIQESVPERLDLKRKTFQTLQEHCDVNAIIASSTSGFTPRQLQGCATRPEQILVAHPFDPVYLLPLVELAGSDKNALEHIENASKIVKSIGMFPRMVRADSETHIADRLLGAVWREALWMIKENQATTQEIDDSIRMGFGLRWAQMGLFETNRTAGGAAGMHPFIEQFGSCLNTDAPKLDAALIEKIAVQSEAQSDHMSLHELEHMRDNNLVANMRALKAQNWAAGAHLNRHDQVLAPTGIDIHQAIPTIARAVPLDWVDYNGHMNEARYLQAFGDATDKFMQIVGCDVNYIATGGSYFTAETHIRHIDEVHAGARIRVESLCLMGKGKKMHLFHHMFEGDRLLATGEHLLLHVDLKTRKSSPPAPHIEARLTEIATAHAKLPLPDGIGRAIRVG